MKTILGLVFFTGLMTMSVAAQKDYCFENDGLKLRQIISYTLTGSKIEGTMESGGYDENTSMETFDFTGTKRGNVLSIKFDDKPPYELPPHVSKNRITWTLGARTLKVPMFGKNYNSGKYSTYSADFSKCPKDQ